jgi:hypothetical protein
MTVELIRSGQRHGGLWQEFRVQRDGGESHTVTWARDEYPDPRCDCAGYRFHRHCAHCDEVVASVAEHEDW